MNQGLRAGLLVLGALFLLSLSPSTRAQELPPELDAIYKRGLELYEAGKFAEAVPVAEEFIGVATARFGEQHALYASGIGGLGVLYQALDRPSEAEPLLKRALSIKEIALGPDHAQVGDALYDLAEFYRKYDRLAEAERLYTRALSIGEKQVGAEYAVSTILSNLGEVYLSQHRYVEAEPHLKRSLEVREKALGLEHHEVAQVLHKLNRLYRAIGRYDEARAVSIRSNEITEKVLGSEHKHLVDESTRNLAHLNLQVLELTRAGKYAEAVPLAERFIAAIEGLKNYGPNSVAYATALNNLASLYLDLSRFGEAERLLLRSLAIREKAQGPDDPEVATSLNNLAELYRKLGRLSDAEPIYRRAIAINERVGGPSLAGSLDNLGNLLVSQARYAEAEQSLKRALAIRERTVGLRNPAVGTTLNHLAQLYLDQRRFAEAEPLYKRSLAIYEDAFGPDHPNVGAVLNNLAWLAYGQRDWARAAAYWRRSTNIITLRAERGVSFGRGEEASGEAQRYAWHFEGLIQTTYRAAAQELGSAPRATLGAEMFEAAQWAHGSEAASSLALMATRSTKGSAVLGGLVRERQDLVSEWQAKNRQLVAAKGEPWAKRKTDDERILADRISSIDARLADIEGQFAREFPDYTALASVTPVSVVETQGQLGENEALVLFVSVRVSPQLPEETFIWVVTKSDMRWVRSDIGPAALAHEVMALRCGLDETAWHGIGLSKCANLLNILFDKTSGPNEPLPFDHTRAQKLYLALFGEVQDLISGKHLLIVASGALTQLPFPVLVTKPPTSGDHRAVAWLAREHAITALPAVSSLKALRRVSKPSAAARPLVGFGNPLLDGPDASYANRAKLAREKQRCPDGRSQRMAGFAGPSGGAGSVETRSGLADVSLIKKQVPLPETADELCAVARDVKAEARDIRLGALATERDMKRLGASGELAKYRMMHFATHGVLAGQLDGTREPGLILTPPDKATEEDDGYLSASEIANLKLDADWVILSAYNTAAGGATSAEALSGLARAFIYAQARALLVSHWEVYSDATVKLITASVREMARDPKVGRSEALRRSMLALIHKGEPHEAHPAYWAPFVVVGEGGLIDAVAQPTTVSSPTQAKKTNPRLKVQESWAAGFWNKQ